MDSDGAFVDLFRRKIEHALVETHQQVEAVHVMKTRTVLGGRVVVEGLGRNRSVDPDVARGVQNCRAPAVDRTMRPFRVAAIEVDAQPAAEAGAVGRDV